MGDDFEKASVFCCFHSQVLLILWTPVVHNRISPVLVSVFLHNSDTEHDMPTLQVLERKALQRQLGTWKWFFANFSISSLARLSFSVFERNPEKFPKTKPSKTQQKSSLLVFPYNSCLFWKVLESQNPSLRTCLSKIRALAVFEGFKFSLGRGGKNGAFLQMVRVLNPPSFYSGNSIRMFFFNAKIWEKVVFFCWSMTSSNKHQVWQIK